uniref:Uncharacterized protein n=1 Tax=Anopheles arabiensis TaxID=7173 RepID=A0A182IA17_ANOAR
MRFSNRRRIAESSIQGVLVAPSTSTPSLSLPTPCICTRNSVLMRRALSLSLSDRAEQSESTSSMKTIDGLWARASSNKFFTSFSDSPSHFETRSELDTEKKVELLASVATAFAKCGNLIGSMTASLSAVLAPSSPATSDHLTCGFSTTIAPSSFACSFFFSGSSESESELSFAFDLSSFAAPSPSFTGFFLPFFRLMQMVVLVYGDYASGIVVPFFGGRVARRSSGKRT